MKVCRVCNTEKELSQFPNHKLYKDGKDTRCSECSKLQEKEQRSKTIAINKVKLERLNAHPDRDEYLREESKRCCRCGVVKALIEFGINLSKKDGFASACKECNRETSRISKRNNPIHAADKLCSRCGEKSREKGSYCLECSQAMTRESNRKRLEGNPAVKKANRNSRLRRNGWDCTLMEVVLDLQGGMCAIVGCENPATNADHDHDTGEARAVLCTPCNTSLGMLNEDPELIRGLAAYAEQCQNVKAWVL